MYNYSTTEKLLYLMILFFNVSNFFCEIVTHFKSIHKLSDSDSSMFIHTLHFVLILTGIICTITECYTSIARQ